MNDQILTVAAIKKLAQRSYKKVVEAWLQGDIDTVFPLWLRKNITIPGSIAVPELIRQVDELRSHSKAKTGAGYSVHWQRVNKRAFGSNDYPQAVSVDSLDDLLKLIRKQSEFQQLQTTVGLIRQRLPQLVPWVIKNWAKLPPIATDASALVMIVETIRDNPRPDLFLRELPLAVSTKLIEQHKLVLSKWLDIVLPPECIDVNYSASQFAGRYGFRQPQVHLLVRLLDQSLCETLKWPATELSLPAAVLDQIVPDPIVCLDGELERVTVFVVENKTNLLTLPSHPYALALGGLGNNLSEFQRIHWLRECKLVYWGDLDVEGLLILARFRSLFPQAESLMMDVATLHEHKSLWTRNVRSQDSKVPSQLTRPESDAFVYCRDHQVRLEQEHIPNCRVLELLGCR